MNKANCCSKMSELKVNAFGDFLTQLEHQCDRPNCKYAYYDVTLLGERYRRLPVSKKILVECAVRKCHSVEDPDQSQVWKQTTEIILGLSREDNFLFHPGRVVLQDFTSVAALVDLAALRDEVAKDGGDSSKVDSLCPADLVVDIFAQVDFCHIKAAATKKDEPPEEEMKRLSMSSGHMGAVAMPAPILHSTFPPFCPYHVPYNSYGYQASPDQTTVLSKVPNDNPGLPIQDNVCPFHQHMSYWSEELDKNRKSEMEKNAERFQFLKWVDASFKNITVVPPGTGAMHQLNLEYLARVVTCQNDVLFPDSVVGTDGHTSMVNGLGVLGWTVGTLEAESVMFGHPLTIPKVPKVIGVKLVGDLSPFSTSTDLVMLITKQLRRSRDSEEGVFVEFFGPSVAQLSISDRSAVANLCSEYGAQVAYFPIDQVTIEYLRKSGKTDHQISVIESYLKKVAIFQTDSVLDYDSVVTIDLSDVLVSVSGPKKAKDRISLAKLSEEFRAQLVKEFGVDANAVPLTVDIDGKLHTVKHGSVLIASIASCTNTSNPTVMLTAGLLAKKAVEMGLSVPKYIKTSLAPGSGVVTSYLRESGVMPYLYMLGFEVIGYGCPKCVENSSTRNVPVLLDAVAQNGLVCCGVLAGNRNFEGRFQRGVKANFLTSAPLTIAFALAGRVDIDFEKEPIGSPNNQPVYLNDIWPTRQEIQEVERNMVIPAMFNQLKQSLAFGNQEWSNLEAGVGGYHFAWNPQSTYIKPPRYIKDLIEAQTLTGFDGLRCLAKFGDDVTSDHISPAGSIVRNSPAADYLASMGLAPRQFNSYGSRRGNWEVMTAGAFSHLKLKNLMASKAGPYTVHQPSKVPTSIIEAANRYKEEGNGLVVIAGENFGRGAPRDWATKGPLSLGVRAVLAISFDDMYRANLVKTGILPLEITRTDWEALKGTEVFHINLTDFEDNPLLPRDCISIKCDDGTVFKAVLSLYNQYEIGTFRSGGVIRDMLRKLNKS